MHAFKIMHTNDYPHSGHHDHAYICHHDCFFPITSCMTLRTHDLARSWLCTLMTLHAHDHAGSWLCALMALHTHDYMTSDASDNHQKSISRRILQLKKIWKNCDQKIVLWQTRSATFKPDSRGDWHHCLDFSPQLRVITGTHGMLKTSRFLHKLGRFTGLGLFTGLHSCRASLFRN